MASWLERLGVRAFPVDRPAALPAADDTKASVMGISDALASILALSEPGSVATPRSALYAYETSSAVAIPVNLVAESFAGSELVLVNRDTGDAERKSPVLDLLRRPHQNLSQQLFLEIVAKHFLVTGEAAIVALGNWKAGEPAALRPICPADMSAVCDDQYGWIGRWDVQGDALRGSYETDPTLGGAVWRSGPLRELRVIRNFSVRHGSHLRGQSKLVAASMDVRQQVEGSQFAVSILRNGGRPSASLHFKNKLDRALFEEVTAQVRDTYAGARNAGKVVVSHGGDAEWTTFTASNSRELEHSEGQIRTAQSIAKIFKVPLVLVNTDAATFSNLETGVVALWDDAVIPLARTILGELSEWILPKFGVDPSEWVIAVDENKVPQLRARYMRELRDRAMSGLEAINEIRKSMPGLEPKEGGDEILVSAALQPLSVVAAELDDLGAPPVPGTPSPEPATGVGG